MAERYAISKVWQHLCGFPFALIRPKTGECARGRSCAGACQDENGERREAGGGKDAPQG